MSNSLFAVDDEDDDFLNEGDDDENEDEPEMGVIPSAPENRPQPASIPQAITSRNKKKRRLRIRSMTPAMMDRQPRTISITMTRDDGTQVIFVRQ